MLLKYVKSILLFCILVILLQGCKKTCGDGFKSYHTVTAPLQVYPQAESIRLGDTLSAEITIPKNAYDTRSNTFIDINGLDFSTIGIDIVQFSLTNSGLRINGLDSFYLQKVLGEFTLKTKAMIGVDLVQASNNLVFKIVIIPKTKGLVKIALYSFEGRKGNRCYLVDFIPKCINQSLNMHLYMNVNPNDAITYTLTNSYYINVN